MPQRRVNKYNSDSAKAYYTAYSDSVVIDYHYDSEKGFTAVYAHKDDDVNVAKTQDYDGLAHQMQYYVVPGFFALIITFFIFGGLVMRDNKAAQSGKDKDSILNMMNNGKKN